jgi:metacaspase-1
MVNIAKWSGILENAADKAVDMMDARRNRNGGNNDNNDDDDDAQATAAANEMDDGSSIPLSQCDGNKKSLFIGINYFGSSAELKGCINDVKNIKEFVTTNFNFPSDTDHMKTLTDDDTDNMPTRENILNGMKWLIDGASNGDSLFLHYSGHGASQKDTHGDEKDGKDETLVPVDYESAGMIIDEDIFTTLVQNLPKGVRLTCIMDCCHSGSILDLPFTYGVDSSTGSIVETDNRKALIKQAIKAGMLLVSGNKKEALMAGYQAVQMHFQNRKNGGNNINNDDRDNEEEANNGGSDVKVRTALADVIQFSGCRDDQTSADASIGGESTGAMSWSLVKSFEQNGHEMTYVDLLNSMRTHLQGKYTQVPQMSTGHRMSMNTTFKM